MLRLQEAAVGPAVQARSAVGATPDQGFVGRRAKNRWAGRVHPPLQVAGGPTGPPGLRGTAPRLGCLGSLASSPTAQIREWVFGQAWARVVRLWTRRGDESGREALAATLARYPEHAASLALLEGRMHRSRGDHAEAAVCFERVLKDGGGELPAALRPHLWAERAAALAAAQPTTMPSTWPSPPRPWTAWW